MVPSENCCRKGCAEDCSHLHKPLRAAHCTDHLREHSERPENDSRNDTITFLDNDILEFPPLCPLPLVFDPNTPVPPTLQCPSHLPLLLKGSSTALPNIYHFIYIFPTVLLLLVGLKMLYLHYSWVASKLQKVFVNRLELPSSLLSNTGIQGRRCLEVKKQISTSSTLHTPLAHPSIQNLSDLFLGTQC